MRPGEIRGNTVACHSKAGVMVMPVSFFSPNDWCPVRPYKRVFEIGSNVYQIV